jgi:hypothetical protein
MMPGVRVAYAYELRRAEEILSTGHLTAEQELAPGDQVAVAGILVSVKEVVARTGGVRLIPKPVSL